MSNNDLPYLVFADEEGKIYDHPFLRMAGASGTRFVVPAEEEIMSLPEGGKFFTLPGRRPVGWNPQASEFEVLRSFEIDGKTITPQAVSCFPPPAYTRTLCPAARIEDEVMLPLWAYTALGWKDGGFHAACVCVDENDQWNPKHFDDRVIEPHVKDMLARLPHNRLLKHLSRCALEYHCFAAKNIFLRRWEIPLPTSPSCNADCVGCLSLQASECCPASQERINFIPTPGEIAEIAVPHLDEAQNPIASFGQGCEGEPLLVADTLEKAIQTIRKATSKGTINLNTNGSLPGTVGKLAQAGLDSVRVSANSVRPEFYNRYYRQTSYTFADVVEFMRQAKEHNLFVMINLLVFPGFTDCAQEYEGLVELIEDTGINMIQMRNLNIDPDYYLGSIGFKDAKRLGIPHMIKLLSERFPSLQFGYFNKTRQSFCS